MMGNIFIFVNREKEYVYVLRDNFDIVGKTEIDNRNEHRVSTRFIGDTVYFDTDKYSDSLIVDLSNPKQPKLIENINISAYSDNLHYYRDNLFFGINYENDSETNKKNIKITMFDEKNNLFGFSVLNYNDRCNDYNNIKSKYYMFSYDNDKGILTNIENLSFDGGIDNEREMRLFKARGISIDNYIYVMSSSWDNTYIDIDVINKTSKEIVNEVKLDYSYDYIFDCSDEYQ